MEIVRPMINPDGSPNTAHTTNPVPIILVDNNKKKIASGVLGDIAPTILDLMDIKQPEAMTHQIITPMKIVFTFLTLALFISCGEVKKEPKQKVTEVTIPNSLKSTTLEGEEILLGKITLDQLKLFSPWYQREYDFLQSESITS